ncbi:MAG: fumarylacetoacetate hydrolase family protein [Gammaproteobacteria bacterium]|nr:fumarylacetoacetate hydrolase family protein [Gammaproteobacteria bacterium]
MKLATFTHDGSTRVGIVVDNEIIDTRTVTGRPVAMSEFLQKDLANSDTIKNLIDSDQGRILLQEVKLEAPVIRPSKFLAVSLNYAAHFEETKQQQPEYPTLFNKQTSCVIGPGDAIHRPRISDKLDYEGELGFVIGKTCRHVPKDRAHEVIAGYLVVNDVTVRDWQKRSHTWTLGKSFDTHGPIGPWLITSDEIGDPHSLDIRTWVNDDLRQSYNTRDMLFDCFHLVEYLSTVCTLEPGDIISTGTGSGVGYAMSPRSFMKAGDVVKIEIENIGQLSNPVIDEPAETAFIE